MQASVKAFGFARVSSEDQARGGISLGLQMDAIRAYCAAKGLTLVKTWEVAETASFDDERVRFKEMLEEYSSSGDVPHLVFYKVDRSNRNTWDHARLEDLVRKREKHLHAALDHFHLHKDAPPSEWDRFEMMGLFARSETRHLSARVKSCIERQTAEGHWSYKAPPGYRKIPRGGIEPDPVQGPLVRELLSMAATGNYSLDVLTREAVQLGIRYQGKALSRSAIHRWLVDPVFAGPFYSKGTLITNFRHTPLIDWRTHERIKERLSDGRRVEKKKVREPRALNGILECAVCGNSVTFFAAKKGRYTYGFCGTCKRSGVKHPFLNERDAAAQLQAIAAQAVLPPEAAELLHAGLYEYRTRKSEALQVRRAGLEARLEAVRQKLSRAFEALSEGTVDGETYGRSTGAWRSEKEKLEIELRELESDQGEKRVAEVENAYKLSQELAITLESATPKALGRIAGIVCTNLRLRDRTIEYSLAFPFNEIAKGHGGKGWRALADAYRTVAADPTWEPTSQMLLLEELLAA